MTKESGTGRARRKAPTPKKITKILIVDDHPMLRMGLRELVGHEKDMGVCGEADNFNTALERVKETKPDLAIVDIALKDSNGLELVKELGTQHPDVKVLVCSMHDEKLFAERALRAGAMGYINKERAIDDVVGAIRCIVGGDVYLSEKMAGRILNRVRSGEAEGASGPVELLTDRELEVFELIGNGLGTSDIAERLCLSPKTVDAHRQKIKRKLELDSSSELTRVAVQWALERTRGLA